MFDEGWVGCHDIIGGGRRLRVGVTRPVMKDVVPSRGVRRESKSNFVHARLLPRRPVLTSAVISGRNAWKRRS